MATIFTKIINREIPGHFVYEDDICVVIMDKFPKVRGQTVVISRKEIDYAFDLDDATYTHMFNVAKKIAKASDKAINAERTCLVLEGFDVPHAHIRVYPTLERGTKLEMGEEASDEELAEVASQLREVLENSI